MKKIRLKVSIVCILALVCASVIPKRIFANSINMSSPNKQNKINVQLAQQSSSNDNDKEIIKAYSQNSNDNVELFSDDNGNEENSDNEKQDIDNNKDDEKQDEVINEENKSNIDNTDTINSDKENLNEDVNEDSQLIDDGVIELKPSKNRINIKLPENQTTGCNWYCEIADEKIAKVVEQGYSFNSHVQQVVGESKIHNWTIEVLRTGIVEMIFTLKKPLNKDIVYDTKKYTIDASDINNIRIIGKSFYDESTGKYIENSDDLNETMLKNKKEYIRNIINETPDVIIDETYFGEVNINKGEIVAIKLKEIPGSEYKWHYCIKDDDTLEFISDGQNLEGNKFLLDGCVLNHYWGFKAANEGQTTVNFKLYKDSQGEKELIRMYKFIINVSPNKENKQPILPKGDVEAVAVK